jgi:DNA polymerase-3 subunit alpha
MSYFSCHNHSDLSNTRGIDAINTPASLIERALECQLSGIAITEHGNISSAVEFFKAYRKAKEKHPNFKAGLGEEIYLLEETEDRKYFRHLILIAKDAEGFKQLREISSLEWGNSETYKGLTRVYLYKEQLQKHIGENPGHLIASSACLGSSLGALAMKLKNSPDDKISEVKQQIIQEVQWYKDIFGEDFYLEVQPSNQPDQLFYNMMLKNVAQATKTPLIFATDSHYGTKEEKEIHKAFLQSQNIDRETDEFYSTTYVMTFDEVKEYLLQTFGKDEIEQMRLNTLEIMEKIEDYNILKPQQVPFIEVPELEKQEDTGYEFIDLLMNNEFKEDRYLMRYCVNTLKKKDLYNKEYLERLNIEAEQIHLVSVNLGQRLSSYFNLVQKMVQIGWEAGSFIGPSRGSAAGYLISFASDITQIDPIKFDLHEWWRFIHESRPELP